MTKRKNILYGIAVNDFDKVTDSTTGKQIPEYVLWTGMLKRVYCKKYQSKTPTYIGSSICSDWHTLSKFVSDISKLRNYSDAISNKGWVLDKDILSKGNKHYSLDTCAFVPVEINSFFGNAVKYKNGNGELPVGVYFDRNPRKNPYYTMISFTEDGERKREYLGCYKTPEEAFNVYKVRKETICKQLAEKYKEVIDDRVYKAMINYEVEITD